MNKYSILEFDGNDKYVIHSVESIEEFKEFIINNFDPKKTGFDFLTKELYFASATKIFLKEKPKFGYYNKNFKTFNSFNTGQTLKSWELIENKPYNNLNNIIKDQFKSTGLNDMLFSSIKRCQESITNIFDNIDKSAQNVTDAFEDLLVYSLEKKEKTEDSPDTPFCHSFVHFFKPNDPFNDCFVNKDEDLEDFEDLEDHKDYKNLEK